MEKCNPDASEEPCGRAAYAELVHEMAAEEEAGEGGGLEQRSADVDLVLRPARAAGAHRAVDELPAAHRTPRAPLAALFAQGKKAEGSGELSRTASSRWGR